MFVLLLMLDDPRVADRVMQAWTDLGIRGIRLLESAGCLEPEGAPPSPGPTAFLSFGHLLIGSRFCYALLLAPASSLEVAQRAAEAVTQVAGPWREGPGAILFALPVAASWGAPLPPETEPGEPP